MVRYDFAKLDAARLAGGLTRSELAQRSGLSTPTVSSILRGLKLNPPSVKKLADALGLDLSSIILTEENDADTTRTNERSDDIA